MFPFLIFSVILIAHSHTAKILCVFPVPSASVLTVYQVISKELSLRGHQVTVITPKPLNDHTLSNLTEIEISTLNDIERRNRAQMEMAFRKGFFFNRLFYYEQYFLNFAEEVLDHIETLFPDPSTNFDLIILENLHQLIYSLGCRFKAPIIGINSGFVPLFVYAQLGVSAYPYLDFNNDIYSLENNAYFFNKVVNFFGTLLKAPYDLYSSYQFDKKSKQYFGKRCPYIEDIVYNVSLVVINTNPVINPLQISVPKLVTLEGLLHVNPDQFLPYDVQRFLDQSTRGIVYFNLGNNLPNTILTTIVQSISQLPYDVLWMIDRDDLPYKPENLMIKKSLIQQNVLGHSHIKVFVSQCDFPSVQEAVIKGVPLVGMPFVFDQFENVRKITELGIARSIEYSTMTKDSLKEVIVDVATNKKYKESAADVKELLQDKPNQGLDKSIWWIEYVIRYKGTKYFRSEAVVVSWIQKFFISLDSSFEIILDYLYSIYQYIQI